MNSTKGMKIGTVKFYVLIIISFIFKYTEAQEPDIGELLSATFIKKEMWCQNGELSFNVVKITNSTDDTLKIRPVINLPEEWQLFSKSFTDTIIPAQNSISLPFRFRPSGSAKSEMEHIIQFKGLSLNRGTLIDASFSVKLQVNHNWNLEIPEKRVVFYPGMNICRFNIKLVNDGNTSENIKLRLQPTRRIVIENSSEDEPVFSINIPRQSDTTLSFTVSYRYDEDRVFDINKIQIHASNNDKTIIRAVILEKYSDTFAPFEVDKTLSHETELGMRTFSMSKEILPFIRARGITNFTDDSKFIYNFTYYDIRNTENIINNSYYNFLYTNEKLNTGIGAFSSLLGRNLYSRNCIMISNEFKVKSNSSIEAYASYGLTTPKTSIAAGYRINNEKINMIASASFNVDEYNKRNTTSIVLNSGRFTLFKNHDFRVNLYGYREDYYLKNRYTQIGYAWDLSYYGNITPNLSIHLTNNYGSPDIPGPQMGLINLYSMLKYSVPETRNHVSIVYINSSRTYYHTNEEGTKLPDINLNDQYINVLFHNNSNKKTRWYIGPSIELYSSSHPVENSNSRIFYNVEKYRMEFKGFFGNHFMLNTKFGIGEYNYSELNISSGRQYDFHLLSDYNNNGYGLRLSYDYGPMVNTGLYQYALDAGNNSINISPYMIKNYFSGRVGVSMFTNYTHRFDMKFGSLNINPRIETYLFRDWYVVTGGTYNYTHQVYSEFDSRRSFYYLELSVKKRWGRSEYDSWKKNLRRLKIQLFKDKNGNGKFDRNEEGIPNVKISIKLVNTAGKGAREHFPVDITLMSNEKGIVTFSRIPKGFYNATIIPLTNLKQYFYIDSNTEQIELNKNTALVIPFQKANKIVGNIDLKRKKFTSGTEATIDLANVKVTAYNKLGDSYSSFTLKDGSFTIYAPGNHIYHIRIKNVFGKEFRVLNNDYQLMLVDTASTPVVFKVVEQNRKINFRKVSPKSPDKPTLQKIKVLPGKVYENPDNKPVDKNAIPDFKIPEMQIIVNEMINNMFYLIAERAHNFVEAEKIIKILREQGVNSFIGVSEGSETYFIYVDLAHTRTEAKAILAGYKTAMLRPITIIKYNSKPNKKLD
jgi:hypothetical protein